MTVFEPVASSLSGSSLGQPIITPPPADAPRTVDGASAPVPQPQPNPAPASSPRPNASLEQPEFNLLRELQKATTVQDEEGKPALAKDELAALLEGFAAVLRGELGRTDVALADKNAEISQLKELLLEAQETIIGLLNDRVFDRAKIARLEAESRVIPDMQSQANRAMGLAIRAEEMQQELTHVRAEVERLRTSYMRSDQGFFSRLFGRKI